MISWALRFMGYLGLAWTACVGIVPAAEAATPVPVEKTLAFELFAMEREARPLPSDYETVLRKVLEDGLAAGGAQAPANEKEFIAFAERVAVSFARHNFIQPYTRQDWPDSIGQALTPRPRSGRVAAYLGMGTNPKRRPYLDLSKPLYLLDCDMASMLLMSVAQMAGFELNLVEVPEHNFVRWHSPDGRVVGWDWTEWGSYPDSHYIATRSLSKAQLLRKTYLQSQSASESRGYLIGVLAMAVQDPAKRLAYRRMAVEAAPTNPATANNAAWSFATIPDGVSEEERRDAIIYGLAAWSNAPDDLDYIDTVACSFGARGNWALAVALETYAAAQKSTFEKNLERLKQEQLCTN